MSESLKKHVVVRVGDGKSTSLWHDTWHPLRPLHDIIASRIVYESRLSHQAKVSDVVVEGQWTWPTTIQKAFPQVVNQAAIIPSNLPQDVVVWRSSDDRNVRFYSRQAWLDIAPASNSVPWSSIVCIGTSIPRHSFILWLAIRQKLLTQDKMQF
ncbi:uncharacterized protein LOC116119264 [Pistacia vera]|uniref:uncharacterized protein LOC116119264 n=1 Tax=Pistacia vera TaxID=55513 RepID=UPI001262B159|nr:uncharacterized protein LOC116119264 [Pistacia vera]